MERFFVFTLGFHEDFAVRRLTSFAAGRGDGFLCVTLKPAAGATVRAYNNLVSFASVNGVTAFGLLEVDMSNPALAVATVFDKVLEVAGGARSIVFDLSGGSRGVIASTLFAAILLSISGFDVDVYVSSEGGDVWDARFPSNFLKLFTLSIGDQKLRILELLHSNQGLQAHEIAERLGLSEKTAVNRLSELSRLELVARKGRGGGAYLTQWGELVALVARAMKSVKRVVGESEG